MQIYLLFRFKGNTGLNLIVVLLSVNVILPCTVLPLTSFTENVLALIDELRIGALNVAVTGDSTSIPKKNVIRS
jgi:hypothetical protein